MMARRTSSCAICENSNLASICTVCVNYRIWLGFSTVFSLIFIVIVFDLTLRDGINAPPRDYSIKGSDIDKVFTTIGASASLVFVFNTGMIPEIQATVRQPVVGNMMKALYFQFTIGVLPLYAITFMGYWAYGNDASEYLLNNANGPVWVKAFANMFAFLQSVITSHECVRRRVMKSLVNNPYCSEAAAKDAMEAVWDTCYNDTKPFDRAP